MLNETDFFGQDAPDKVAEKVVLYDGAPVWNGGTIALPEPLTSYENVFIVGAAVLGGYNFSKSMGVEELLSIFASGKGYSLFQYAAAGTSGNYANIYISGDANSINITAQSSYAATDSGVYKIVGFKKRYVTQNQSAVIPVNGGNNVVTGEFYDVDLPAEFYDHTGKIKDGVTVRAELYMADSSTPDWYDVGFVRSEVGTGRGCRAVKQSSKVVVVTGAQMLVATDGRQNGHTVQGLPFNVSAAPCRVVAILNDAIMLRSE